jgi:hypothetical protein
MVGLSIAARIHSINDEMKDRGLYNKVYLEEIVYKYPTKHMIGFTELEQKEMLDLFENINMDKYNNAMMGNTCMMDAEDGIITYHCDVLTALKCAIENRNQTLLEWD